MTEPKTKRNKKKDKKRRTFDKYGKNTPKGLRQKLKQQESARDKAREHKKNK